MLCRYIAVLFVGGWLACPDGRVQACAVPVEPSQTWCVDLSNGVKDSPPAWFGASWRSYTAGKGCCNDQAVLSLHPPCWAKSLKIDETAVNSNGWTLNVGDSSTNNGWAGGDPGTTNYCAELQILDGKMSTYKNNIGSCAAQLLAGSTGTVGSTRTSSITVEKNGLRATSLPSAWGFSSTCNSCLYNWDDIYIGMNRVIKLSSYSATRSGTGLCKVCLTWSQKSTSCLTRG